MVPPTFLTSFTTKFSLSTRHTCMLDITLQLCCLSRLTPPQSILLPPNVLYSVAIWLRSVGVSPREDSREGCRVSFVLDVRSLLVHRCREAGSCFTPSSPFLFCVSGQLQQHNADAQRGYLDKKGSVSLSFWSRAAVSCPQKGSKCS